MIFQKGNMWKISGYPEKYTTLEAAEKALSIINKNVANAQKIEEQKEAIQRQQVALAEEERLKKLTQLAEDSTPFEKMIAKNICKLCNLEPCECFTSIKKTELGRFEETTTSSL